MYNLARVEKLVIVKSCAEKTAAQHRLSVSFFFFCTQHVDDPLQFFTTIAHQLTIEIDEYRKALDLKIQHNPTLPSKELDV